MKGKPFLCLLMVLFVSCARTPGRPGENPAAVAPPIPAAARETEVGQQIHQAIISSFRVYTEPRLVGYVTKVGEGISRFAERQDLVYRFTVLYDDRVYATNAPGGFVYITTGFLNFLENESELAAVLAHEIAELQYRDQRFSGSRRVLSAAAQTGAVVGPLFGPFGTLGATGLVLLHAFAESRDATPEERIQDADKKALHYLVRADQDPQGYFDLLSRFLNPDPRLQPYSYDYLSSRPVTLKRYQAALEEFENLPLEGKSFSVNRDTFLEMTKGVREIYKRPA